MCGRAYETYTQEELELRYLSRVPIGQRLPISPNFNLAPTQLSPLVRVSEGERRIELAKWGLIPFVPKGEKRPFAPINAKSETVMEKPMFRQSFARRRCIVPVSGFFEWKKCDDRKRPYAIRLRDEKIMSLAGIYSTLTLPTGEVIDTFCVLTTEPNRLMIDIHDRMPVILDREHEDLWLDPRVQETDKLKPLLRPFPESRMEAFEVSTLVNSTRNNLPEILDPVRAEGGS